MEVVRVDGRDVATGGELNGSVHQRTELRLLEKRSEIGNPADLEKVDIARCEIPKILDLGKVVDNLKSHHHPHHPRMQKWQR